MTIRKLLIANRGEIACRVIRTARDLGIATVAVYSDADASAMHVAMADEAVRIGPAPVGESYLKGDTIIDAATRTGADAIHPGYGFLSENPDFVDAVEKAGLVFVGPSAEAIRAMGLKDQAKALMEKAGVPVVPGYHGDDQDPAALKEKAGEIGYPVLIKARAGGGGKGMRLVERAEDFEEAFASARREGQNSFGDPACLIEKYIEKPRHIEVQIFGDQHGHVVHLFERDCSLQRRHQKVIEEAPAPGMTEDMRAAMGEAAVQAAKAVNYAGAGTVEFIVDASDGLRPDGFWFMEMNTRLQVEHPVTEYVTGLDLVALQIAVAQGEELPFAQDDLTLSGHAFEARLYAEDAEAGFLPATGELKTLRFAEETGGVRIDTGVRQGDAITPHYDPMIAKIITYGPDRSSALAKLERALEETIITGSVTNRAFLARLAADPDFAAGDVDTGLIARKQDELAAADEADAETKALAVLALLQRKEPGRFTDPFEALADFRLYGAAQQLVLLDDKDGGAQEIAVRSERDGARHVSLPEGLLSFEAFEIGPDGALTFRRNGHLGRAVIIRDGGTVTVARGRHAHSFTRHDPAATDQGLGGDGLVAPMPGLVRQVSTSKGTEVEKGQTLIVLEAMKMEHSLTAPRDGVIAELMVKEGDQVEQGAVLLQLEPEEE
ncbi:acetyl/propionyl/methylcrotonyl-CoA carboxylase subunit alpha [Notoacmeibacter ruber]|uniref:Acetyl/propionyl/methylcrotonyl-CoA carboxylase subunit alpha n=1 Tax=Notoacmeibacter ruber TaxID=2670375 RepID=A0A3L7JJ70_9HYPH|nr:acetyl/propionyl/methylcrotonyl-CoA carboxylase subunit alpha [Notoacmeibacter ruber]RLQ88532.1 acetyl/propionyl/methylcrotonyl-CoA carboxylase subunit alpha [Notoacmeibacter ruber]